MKAFIATLLFSTFSTFATTTTPLDAVLPAGSVATMALTVCDTPEQMLSIIDARSMFGEQSALETAQKLNSEAGAMVCGGVLGIWVILEAGNDTYIFPVDGEEKPHRLLTVALIALLPSPASPPIPLPEAKVQYTWIDRPVVSKERYKQLQEEISWRPA